MGGRRGAVALGVLLPIVAPLYAPQLLAFPYKAATPMGTVWSESPIAPGALAEASQIVDARMAATPLAGPAERRPIFLTDGGWRWAWLVPGNQSAFAISRPLTKAVVVNRARLSGAAGTPTDAKGGNRRALGPLLAHEFTHGLIRRRYGVLASLRFPQWKVEGYADYVAGESTLDSADVARLEASGTAHPAIAYFRGRQRVAAFLAKPGATVDGLFGNSD